jgi:RimJ/RimL family protein N-acetyltransferase
MKHQTFIRTERLQLVLLSTEDAPQLTRWLNDSTITDYLARGDYPITTQAEEEYLEKLYKDQTHLQLGILHKADAKLIGTVGMHHIKARDRTASFGIMIGEPDYWSNGYGTEVLEAMLSWAFAIRDLRNVTLSVLSNNPRGQRCYEKCGFTVVGTYPKHIFKNGDWHDEILMQVTNPTYM